MKNWTLSNPNKDLVANISEKFNISYFIATILNIKGINDEEKIKSFLNNDILINDPYEIKDMELAVKRINEAIDNFEKICVFGDYDADGVTATSLLYSFLQSKDADVIFYIPKREEYGYGLNFEIVDKLKSYGVNLIITVDNGISAVKEVDYANNLGIDVVITDHHKQNGDIIPNAVAVIDPNRDDCKSSFKDLAGVGVAFKLVLAIEGNDYVKTLLEEYSDLVSLGTVGDLVSLNGENRDIVKVGLNSLCNSERVGIKALISDAGMGNKVITSRDISFNIVPRINAVGRLGSSDRAVQLLLSEDAMEAESLAIELGCENDRRKDIEREITLKVEAILKNNPEKVFERVIIVSGEGWHPGVIGIVASKITQKYDKPCIIISFNGEEAVGSARSIKGFSIYDAIYYGREYLTKFGGHPMAGGFSLKTSDIKAFELKINEYAKQEAKFMPVTEIDLTCRLKPSAISLGLVEQLSLIEPFGCGNEVPIFGLYGMKLVGIISLSNDKHIKLSLSKEDTTINAIKFSLGVKQFPYAVDEILDLAVCLEENDFNGKKQCSILINDIRLHGFNYEKALKENQLYEMLKRGEVLSDEELSLFIPSRTDFAIVYRYLKLVKGWHLGIDLLCLKIDNDNIGFGKLRLILDIMQELGLINLDIDKDIYNIELNNINYKVDLNSSKILECLRQNDGE